MPDTKPPSAEPDAPYVYGARPTPDMTRRVFRVGEGRISSTIAVTFGALSLLGVLCFRYPELLTTPELREVYDVDAIRLLLKFGMWSTLLLGLLCIVRSKRRGVAILALGLVSVAWALGGYGIEGRSVQPSPVFAGVDWMVLDLFGSALLFIFIEKLLPKYPEQAILRPEWRMDLLYFVVNHLLIGLFLLISNGFAPLVFGWATHEGMQSWMQAQALPVQLLILILCADLVQYWVHRIFHEVPLLWRFHAVHHCAEHMDWLAGSRTHLFQTITDRALVMVPLYLLGPSLDALNFSVAIAAFQAVFIHANFGLRFGPLRYLVVTPQFHHWHHSKDDPAIDTNYAVHTPLFDLLFGSFHLPKGYWPKEYGTVSPLPKTFMGQFAYPFRADKNTVSEESEASKA